MESTMTTSMTGSARLCTVAFGTAQNEFMRTSSGLRTGHLVPAYGAFQGTRVSALAPIAVKATALFPINDVVVLDGTAGIRTWSPPV